MATFRLNNKKISYENKPSYIIEGPIDRNDLIKINRLSGKTLLILKNTKGQSTNILRAITNPNIEISVYGGVDYLTKNKFNRYDYIERTIYSPKELAAIIEYFEEIEKEINPSWTETEKCMYIYKVLCESNHYKYDGERSFENNKDVVRSLSGVLYGKLVCSGFAVTLKEMLDRNNIEAHYQNRPGHHSWVVAKLDGYYRGLELTWDCYNKKDNTCGFAEFGQDADFYKNKHHIIDNEPEERIFPLKPYTPDELLKAYKKMLPSKNSSYYEGQTITNIDGKKVSYIKMNASNKKYGKYLVSIGKRIYAVSIDENNPNLPFLFSERQLEFATSYNKGFVMTPPKDDVLRTTKYVRRDKSEFIIIESSDSPYSKKQVRKYWYAEVDDQKNIMSRHAIYSENDLINVPEEYKAVIANGLLSKERIARKIAHFKGYVGYVSESKGINYSERFENEVLELTARK